MHVVVPGTPADQAGLKPGDVITKLSLVRVGEKEVEDAESLIALLQTTRPRQEIDLTYVRKDQPSKTVKIALVRRPLEVMRQRLRT